MLVTPFIFNELLCFPIMITQQENNHKYSKFKKRVFSLPGRLAQTVHFGKQHNWIEKSDTP